MSRYNGARGGGVAGVQSVVDLPDSLITEILQKVDLESLCSIACVSKAFNSFVSLLIPTRSSIDLSVFSPDAKTLHRILNGCKNVRSLTVDCRQLEDSAIAGILGANLEELNMLKGALLSSHIFLAIDRSCPNLRFLTLELHGVQPQKQFKKAFNEMLKSFIHLESLSILIRGINATYFISSQLFLPSTLKVLKLQEVRETVVIRLLERDSDDDRFLESISGLSGASLSQPFSMLWNLSLVLDIMSDELIRCIVNALPLLVELNLKDRPSHQPYLPDDLSNNGLQLLSLCEHLTTLSLVRSRLNHPASFQHVNDMGMMLFAENCNNGALESVTLGGFSTVTDAGFAAILNSCRSLNRFEVRNVPRLSDMTFSDRSSDPDSLVELRLLSCRHITSEAVDQLAPHAGLQALDISGCTNMTDLCVSYLKCFRKLTSLNLARIDVSDGGLGILGSVQSPIARLCLRGCKAITDEGICLLLKEGGISKTLTHLDLGHVPGISDKAVCMIAASAPKINELCLRYCSLVTDASVRILGSTRGWHRDRNMSYIQRLDLASCNVSIDILKPAREPLFPKLRWVGIRPAGYTFSAGARDPVDRIRRQRPWLFICCEGHEMECYDEWDLHQKEKYLDERQEESHDEWEEENEEELEEEESEDEW